MHHRILTFSVSKTWKWYQNLFCSKSLLDYQHLTNTRRLDICVYISYRFIHFSLWYQSNQKFYGEINILFAFYWTVAEHLTDACINTDQMHIFMTTFFILLSVPPMSQKWLFPYICTMPQIYILLYWSRTHCIKKKSIIFCCLLRYLFNILFNIVIQILEWMFFHLFLFLIY